MTRLPSLIDRELFVGPPPATGWTIWQHVGVFLLLVLVCGGAAWGLGMLGGS